MGSHHFGVLNFEFQISIPLRVFRKMNIFGGMKILWISFGVITKHQKVNQKNGPGLRMYENIRGPPPPLLTQVRVCLEFVNNISGRHILSQIAKIRWAHVGSWWKCGRRRIPTLYQHRTNATMSTILSLLNTTILLQNPLCLYSE